MPDVSLMTRLEAGAAGGPGPQTTAWLRTTHPALASVLGAPPTNLVYPLGFQSLPNSVAVLTAFRIYLMRFVVPKTGTLTSIAYWIGVQSGNYNIGVYDTGEALAGSRTKIFEIPGATAVVPAVGWKEMATPALAVAQGQHIDVAFQVDNATASIGRQSQGSSGGVALPAGYAAAAAGAVTKLMGTGGTPGALGLPATIAEATVADPSTQAIPHPLLTVT